MGREVGQAGAGEHGIDCIDHGRRVAPGFVLGARLCLPICGKPFGSSIEQARISAAKTVDRLLRVADQQHAGARAVVTIGFEPAFERGPLQSVGVLKFIQQHVAVAGVETRMQIGRVIRIGQLLRSAPLGIGEVDQPARGFERLIFVDQQRACAQGAGVDRAGACSRLRGIDRLHGGSEMGVQFEETLHLPAQAHAQRAAGFARGARCAFFLEPDLFDGVEPGLADCLIRRVRIEQAVEHRRKRHVGFDAVLHQQRQELAHRFALARGHLLDRINAVTHPELCAQLGIGIRHGVFAFLPIGPPLGAAREQIHQALLGVVEAELAHQTLECLRVRALGIGP